MRNGKLNLDDGSSAPQMRRTIPIVFDPREIYIAEKLYACPSGRR